MIFIGFFKVAPPPLAWGVIFQVEVCWGRISSLEEGKVNQNSMEGYIEKREIRGNPLPFKIKAVGKNIH